MTAIAPLAKPATRDRRISAERVEAHAQSAVEEEPNYRSIYISTIFAMTLLFLVGVGVPAAYAYGAGPGWGLGAFCAFWGGPSFGVMAASARVSAWFEAHEDH